MNVQKILKAIDDKYPGKKTILDPPENPTEIVCELEPTSDHPEQSTALAIVGRSKPHYHKISTEIYEAVKGTLTVYKDGQKFILKEGEKITIKPNVIHHVEGVEAWFLTYSKPGWIFEDHIIVE